MGRPILTNDQVVIIRQQAADGTLDARAWATELRCNIETIRKAARKDSYNTVAMLPAFSEVNQSNFLEALASFKPQE